MKYEFVQLTDEFKNRHGNIFYNAKSNKCFDLSEIIDENKNLKFPISVFVNGLLVESSNYNFKNKILTITNNDYFISDEKDSIAMIFTSTNKERSGYVKQMLFDNYDYYSGEDKNIEIDEDNEILVTKDNTLVTENGYLKFSVNKEVLGISVNGVLYGTEEFTILNHEEMSIDDDGNSVFNDLVVFVNPDYRPIKEDNVSIFILEKSKQE